MKYIEFRRHSYRGDGDNLSQRGISYAKEIGLELKHPYDLYISSPRGRAIETIQYFGASNYEINNVFSIFPEIRFDLFDSEITYYQRKYNVDFYTAIFKVPNAYKELLKAVELYKREMEKIYYRLPEGGRALVVSHSGTIEPLLCLGFTEYNIDSFGNFLNPCEGGVLKFEKAWPPVGVEIIRNKECITS